MINAKELRIGNLVRYREHLCSILSIASWRDVTLTTQFDIEVKYMSHLSSHDEEPEAMIRAAEGIMPDELEPIELTEEVMKQCRFSVNPERGCYCDETSLLSFKPCEGQYAVIYEDKQIAILSSLHQLQNLYFFLTQTEIEFGSR